MKLFPLPAFKFQFRVSNFTKAFFKNFQAPDALFLIVNVTDPYKSLFKMKRKLAHAKSIRD